MVCRIILNAENANPKEIHHRINYNYYYLVLVRVFDFKQLSFIFANLSK